MSLFWSYLSGKESERVVLYFHLWPVWHSHIFPHYLIKGTIFWEKLLNTKYVFWYSLQLMSETFLILREIQQDIIIKHIGLRGPGSSVGITIAYGLDGPGIESRWGEIFRTSSDRPWGPSSLLYNGYRVFPGGKVLAGAWRWPLTPF